MRSASRRDAGRTRVTSEARRLEHRVAERADLRERLAALLADLLEPRLLLGRQLALGAGLRAPRRRSSAAISSIVSFSLIVPQSLGAARTPARRYRGRRSLRIDVDRQRDVAAARARPSAARARRAIAAVTASGARVLISIRRRKRPRRRKRGAGPSSSVAVGQQRPDLGRDALRRRCQRDARRRRRARPRSARRRAGSRTRAGDRARRRGSRPRRGRRRRPSAPPPAPASGPARGPARAPRPLRPASCETRAKVRSSARKSG